MHVYTGWGEFVISWWWLALPLSLPVAFWLWDWWQRRQTVAARQRAALRARQEADCFFELLRASGITHVDLGMRPFHGPLVQADELSEECPRCGRIVIVRTELDATLMMIDPEPTRRHVATLSKGLAELNHRLALMPCPHGMP
jgi:hypothetical protein